MTKQTALDFLIASIRQKNSLIGVIGLGYVGLPLALTFAENGYRVMGFDIDETKNKKLANGTSYLRHIPQERIQRAVEAGRFSATSDFSLSAKCDALIICVPTPLGKHNEPDLSYIVQTAKAIAPFFREGQVISLESTTYPGTTEEVLLPIVQASGLRVGDSIFLVYSPEREDPGNLVYDTSTIPKVLGGFTENCGDAGVALYQSVINRVVRVSSTRAAELTKLLENIHRAVNIGLVNEMKIVADAMSIDINEVIDAAATKPFGFTAFRPGPGLGGHCIPIDPFYLTWKAKEYGINTRFIELAGEINSYMPTYVVGKLSEGLNKNKLSVAGSNILVLGLAYKKNIDDYRESPSIEIINKLLSLGAIVSCYDSYTHEMPQSRNWKESLPILVQNLDSDLLSKFDACILCTDHDGLDYEQIASQVPLFVDTRGRVSDRANVIRA